MSSTASNVSSTLDPEVIERLRKVAAATKHGISSEVKEEPSKKIPFVSTDGMLAFSKVFGMKPAARFPDFPVRVFKHDEWHESIRSRIPAVNTKYHFNADTLSQFMFALYTGGPVLLHGPTGTGKTSLAEQVCARTNRPFLRVACHKHQESDAFLGRPGIVNDNGVPTTKHTHTDTTLAATHGGMLCIDEAFRSPILMAVQPLLETPPYLTLQDCEGIQSVLRPDASKFSVVLTDNTNGTGDGTGSYISEAQDLSTITRIRTAIFIDYMSGEDEAAMLSGMFPNITTHDINNMVKIAKLIRDAFTKQAIMQVMDIRALIAWAENASLLGNSGAGFRLAFHSRLSPADQQVVNNCYRQVTGTNLA